MRTSISLEHIAAFLSSRGGVMSPVALRFHDSAIPTPQSSGRRARSALFLGVMVFRAGLQARAPRFFVLLLVVHIIPLKFFRVLRHFTRARRFIGGGQRLFRLAPVAQHLPARAVREVSYGPLAHAGLGQAAFALKRSDSTPKITKKNSFRTAEHECEQWRHHAQWSLLSLLHQGCSHCRALTHASASPARL